MTPRLREGTVIRGWKCVMANDHIVVYYFINVSAKSSYYFKVLTSWGVVYYRSYDDFSDNKNPVVYKNGKRVYKKKK